MNIGRNIRERREALGMNRNQLSMDARISWGHLEALEGGRTNPSVKTLERIATALNCTVAELCE